MKCVHRFTSGTHLARFLHLEIAPQLKISEAETSYGTVPHVCVPPYQILGVGFGGPWSRGKTNQKALRCSSRQCTFLLIFRE